MDPQWQAYNDPSGASRRHNGSIPQQQPAPPQQPPTYKYDHYHHHGGAPVAGASAAGASPMGAPQIRDGNGDIPMHDAHDAHAGIKYPMRPLHQSHPSSGRTSGLHSPADASSAAQRYSPMDTLSPSSPYAPKPPNYSNPPSQRQSPSKAEYPTSPYYPARQAPPPQQQLPALNTYAATPSHHDAYPSSAVSATAPELPSFPSDAKSPRRQVPMPAPRGPVPEFRKVRGPTDLRPKMNHQPPFRRANPEGGFISVSPSSALSPRPTRSNASEIQAAKVLTFIAAPPSLDLSPPGDISHLQPRVQVRDVTESAPCPYQAQQRSQERRL